MSKKSITILLAAILILGAGLFWLFSGKGSETTPTGGAVSFPSGGEGSSARRTPSGGMFPGGQEDERDFVQLTQNAVAGAAMSSTTVRYIEKSTGHIYEISPQGKDLRRISNTTILKIFKALWSPFADKLIISYLEDNDSFGAVKTFSAGIDVSSKSISGVFFPKEVKEAAIAPGRDRIFYLQEYGDGIIGVAADFDNQNKNPVFLFPFGKFNIDWLNKNTITLLTKPSSAAEGFLYFFNPFTEKLKKILGGVKGLEALPSPDGKRIIYSRSEGNGFETEIFDRDAGETGRFGLKTLAEKCVWSKLNGETAYCGVPGNPPRSEYPDAWHKGKVSFTDSIWAADALTGETKLLLKETNADVVDVFLSPNEDYLIFTNKKDGTLWRLRLGYSQ